MRFHAIIVIRISPFIGAVGKFAQIGSHTRSPDATEGPTPVSTSIHVTTTVTTRVFVIARCSPSFKYSPMASIVITSAGAMTSFSAITTRILQNDSKRVIAHPTRSQSGYMIPARGISNYSVSVSHSMNHAFPKALLFSSAGSVIHTMLDEQDMRKMGVLASSLPFTYAMMLIGNLFPIGFPFPIGFYSKDVIPELAYTKYTISGNFASDWEVSLSFPPPITLFGVRQPAPDLRVSRKGRRKEALGGAHKGESASSEESGVEWANRVEPIRGGSWGSAISMHFFPKKIHSRTLRYSTDKERNGKRNSLGGSRSNQQPDRVVIVVLTSYIAVAAGADDAESRGEFAIIDEKLSPDGPGCRILRTSIMEKLEPHGFHERLEKAVAEIEVLLFLYSIEARALLRCKKQHPLIAAPHVARGSKDLLPEMSSSSPSLPPEMK
eukprot:Gb_41733 [translate_table: standard]